MMAGGLMMVDPVSGLNNIISDKFDCFFMKSQDAVLDEIRCILKLCNENAPYIYDVKKNARATALQINAETNRVFVNILKGVVTSDVK
jgi:hypothetical protein